MEFNFLKFDERGLIPAIVQDAENGEVLMMAWMNDEALRKTADTGLTHFYSRSRGKLWLKGESSGHVQRVRRILYDCDADCLLVKVRQEVAACHTGHRSCFYRTLEGIEVAGKVFDEEKVYGRGGGEDVLDRLFKVITSRRESPSPDSYTSRLLEGGMDVLGDKVLEEAGELVCAASGGEGTERVVSEAADLVYHVWVLLAAAGASPDLVREELSGRFGKSGLEEKRERKED